MPLSPLYVALKAAAYCAWCTVGLRRRRPDLGRRALTLRAVAFGLLRALLGLGFGTGIWLASSQAAAGLHARGVDGIALQGLVYLAVYVPVRLVEWSLISAAAFRAWDARWVAGGILLSVAADVPMVVALGGLPLGRFMC